MQLDAQIVSIYSVPPSHLHSRQSFEERGLELIEKGAVNVEKKEEGGRKGIRRMIFDLLVLRSGRIRGSKRKSEGYRPFLEGNVTRGTASKSIRVVRVTPELSVAILGLFEVFSSCTEAG